MLIEQAIAECRTDPEKVFTLNFWAESEMFMVYSVRDGELWVEWAQRHKGNVLKRVAAYQSRPINHLNSSGVDFLSDKWVVLPLPEMDGMS